MLEDTDFDFLCKLLFQEYPRLPEEFQKRVTKASLQAGTGYKLKYRRIEKSVAYRIHNREDIFIEATKHFQEKIRGVKKSYTP